MAQQQINQSQINMNPMVFAWRPNGSTSTITGPTILICSTAIINTGSAYNTTTGVFTAPKAGNYYVNFTGFKNNDTSTGALYIRKNSGASQYRTYTSTGTTYESMSIVGIIPCTTGDTIDIYVGTGLVMHGNESSQLVIMYVGQ